MDSSEWLEFPVSDLYILPPAATTLFSDLGHGSAPILAAGHPESPFSMGPEEKELTDDEKKERLYLEHLRYGHFDFTSVRDILGPMEEEEIKDWQDTADALEKQLRHKTIGKDSFMEKTVRGAVGLDNIKVAIKNLNREAYRRKFAGDETGFAEYDSAARETARQLRRRVQHLIAREQEFLVDSSGSVVEGTNEPSKSQQKRKAQEKTRIKINREIQHMRSFDIDCEAAFIMQFPNAQTIPEDVIPYAARSDAGQLPKPK